MRYIGNKTKIVDQIESLIKELKINKENYTFFDAFSGTGTVGNYFKDKFKIIAMIICILHMLLHKQN